MNQQDIMITSEGYLLIRAQAASITTVLHWDAYLNAKIFFRVLCPFFFFCPWIFTEAHMQQHTDLKREDAVYQNRSDMCAELFIEV